MYGIIMIFSDILCSSFAKFHPVGQRVFVIYEESVCAVHVFSALSDVATGWLECEVVWSFQYQE